MQRINQRTNVSPSISTYFQPQLFYRTLLENANIFQVSRIIIKELCNHSNCWSWFQVSVSRLGTLHVTRGSCIFLATNEIHNIYKKVGRLRRSNYIKFPKFQSVGIYIEYQGVDTEVDKITPVVGCRPYFKIAAGIYKTKHFNLIYSENFKTLGFNFESLFISYMELLYKNTTVYVFSSHLY